MTSTYRTLVASAVLLAANIGSEASAQATRPITIEGRLFYNDLREIGHFDWRSDPFGAPGQFVGSASGVSNWLGAMDVVADFYELDVLGPQPLFPTCEQTKLLGSKTITSTGDYSFTTDIADDDCLLDGDLTPDIGVKFRLRFCNSTRCFSVEDDGAQTYELWHSLASPTTPLPMPGASHTLPDGFFQAAADDRYSMAASHYAGLVEATRIWHVENDVPFYYEEFGELFLEFPSSTFAAATTVGSSRMHFPDPSDWPAGGYHEFGHILHNRAWEGSTGSCGNCPLGVYNRNGDPNWSGTELEYPHTALVEGWASFVGVATQHYPDGCGSNWNSNELMPICSADPNEYPQTSAPVTSPHTGKGYPRNVAKLFCAWYDSMFDDDPNMAGGGDHFSASLSSTWSNLETVWDVNGGAAGLDVCSYVDYYLNDRKSAANVGSAVHDDYVALITELIYNAGISCDYPVPP